MDKSVSLPTDLDRAADTLAGFIADPSKQAGGWPSRFLGADAPFVLKALLRQAHLQETVRDRLLLEWARCKSSAEQHRLLRQARGIGRELHDTLGAIYRLEKDTRQGFPALIVPDELALADAAPPALASPLERVTASDQTYEVFEAEFAELMDKAQQTARPELLWVEDLPTDKPVELLTLSEEDAEAGVSPGLAALIGLEKAREAVGE